MDSFLHSPPERQKKACIELQDEMHLHAQSVEKDLWVCWTLRELFSLPGIGEHLTFKGGSSLSKAWKLIRRFSEDIDLIVDKEALGFGGDAAPDKAASNKQRKARLEALMAASRQWVQGMLQPALTIRIAAALGNDANCKLEVDPDMPDGQCLLLHYPSAFENEAGYIKPVVKIELGARSDDWPNSECPIQPYLAERFPQLMPQGPFPVRVLAAERTFWEKACLLHEETFRPHDKPRKHWRIPLSSSVSPSTEKSSSATRGWTTRRTNPAPSDLARQLTTLPTGAPITKPCSAPCSSAKFLTSTKSWRLSASLRKPSTQAPEHLEKTIPIYSLSSQMELSASCNRRNHSPSQPSRFGERLFWPQVPRR